VKSSRWHPPLSMMPERLGNIASVMPHRRLSRQHIFAHDYQVSFVRALVVTATFGGTKTHAFPATTPRTCPNALFAGSPSKVRRCNSSLPTNAAYVYTLGLSRSCLRCLHVSHVPCWRTQQGAICATGCGCICEASDPEWMRSGSAMSLLPLSVP
jgi:hypothetical protein